VSSSTVLDGLQRLARFLRHVAEAAGLLLFWTLARALPIDWASAMGGWLARLVGPRLPVTKRAARNLARAMPALTEAEIKRIVRAMWDNLGRVAAEQPHVGGARMAERIEVVGEEHLLAAGDPARPTFLLSGHLANWEILTVVPRSRGIPLTAVYRRPNNPIVHWLLMRLRGEVAGLLPKGAEGARGTIKLLREGGNPGLLVDQKMNDGIAVPFFGRDAMTVTAPAELALRYKAAIVLARMERLGGAHFRLTLLPPLAIPEAASREAAVRQIMTRVNAQLEAWIRERPEQWLWLHRRWPD
jgi:Kdo2-lipid IVA lauroyltransferase/acyltransferase